MKTKEIKKEEYSVVTRRKFIPSEGQVFLMPSETIQGETMSIQEIFKRSANMSGFEIQTTEPMYLDVPDIEDIDSMYRQGHDLTDLQAFADRVKDLNDKVEEQQAKAKKEAYKASKEAERQAIISDHIESVAKEQGEKKSEK